MRILLTFSLGTKLRIDKLKKVRDWFINNEILDFGDPAENYFRSRVLPEDFVDSKEVQENEKDTGKGYKIDALHKMLDSQELAPIPLKLESSGTLKMFALYPSLKDIPWIIFDRDQVKDFDEIIRLAEKNDINVGWSNPCFEIWICAYFGAMPAIRESYTCCEQFAKKFEKATGKMYSKNDRDIYRKLVQFGNEEKAIEIAEKSYNKCLIDGKEKSSEM